MCILFSINHGCVTAVLNLSVVLLGDKGSFMSGVLYIMYAATALLASTAIVGRLGVRGALCTGCLLYCVYIFSFPLALIAHDDASQLAIALVGGAVGGVAAGFLWAAQGSYFATSAKLYAEATNTPPEKATSTFAATFGMLFLGLEVVLKAFPLALKGIEAALSHPAHAGPNASRVDAPPSAPPPPSAHAGLPAVDLIVAVAYSIFAILAALGMFTVWDIDRLSDLKNENANDPTADDALASAQAEGAAPPPRPGCTLERVVAAVALWCKRPTVVLLAPIQATFGVSSALLAWEVTGRVVKQIAFPHDSVVVAGLLSGLVALVAGALQWPFKLAANAFGKMPVMLVGLSAFAGLGTLCFVLDGDQLAHHVPLVSCYLLHAVGRACFEGTNKALYADFFAGGDESAAFSNIVIANGLASAIAFFTYPELPRKTEATVVILAAAVAVVCYLTAESIHRGQRASPSALGD